MRILVAGYETPAYPGAGGPGRLHSLLEPLAGRHTIRVVTTGGPPPFGRPPAGVEIVHVAAGPEVMPDGDGAWFRRNLDHQLHGPPWLHWLAMHHVVALRAVLGDHIADFRPDVVQVEHGELGALLDLVPRGVASVLVLHNMLTSVQTQLVRIAPTRSERAKAVVEIPVMAWREGRDIARSSGAVVTTERDRRLARWLAPTSPVDVVPNCIDAGYFQRPSDSHPRPRMVFTASFHYPPNQRAAVELMQQVLPAVRSRVAGAELALVGQRMPRWLADLAARTPGVVPIGGVDDVRPELWRSQVAVAPLRTGSGSPLKVMEALAAGVPVVATPRVAEALRVGRDHGVLVANRAPDIAAVVVDVLGDPGLRARLSAAGTAAASRFDRGPAALLQERVWQRAVDRSR